MAVHELLDRCTFPEAGTRVRCGLSGGPDSTALVALAVAAGCEVCAVHVDHGLRAGSGDDVEVVARIAAALDVELTLERVQVDDGPNLEERARVARHGVLGPEAMLGHTADDQAETLLLALLRGTGLHGLAAMRRGERRPILALRRTETEQVCAELDLETVVDPTNASSRFRRNRVRSELMPLMADISQRDPVPLLVRTAESSRDAADLLDELAAELDPTDVHALRAAPPLLARMALRAWIRGTSPLQHPPDSSALARCLEVVTGEARATELAGGWRLERSAGRLRLVHP